MAVRNNTLVNALEALKAVLLSAELATELAFFNTEHSWRLPIPAVVDRRIGATVGLMNLPYVVLSVSSDSPVPYTATLRTYHTFGVDLLLQLASANVADTCSYWDLSKAGEIYADCIRKTLLRDVSTTDPNSTLRNAGVFMIRGTSTNLLIPPPGVTTDANLINLTMKMTLSQVREGA